MHNFDFFQKCFVSIVQSQETNRLKKIHNNKVGMGFENYFLIEIKRKKTIFKAIFLSNLKKMLQVNFNRVFSILEMTDKSKLHILIFVY